MDPEAVRADLAFRFLIVLRSEADGVWRVAMEVLVSTDTAAD
jgi:ketosteroid isomerase-like protein